MANPENFRAYGVLLRDAKVLIAAEFIGDAFAWKFPGGGVLHHEDAEQALKREFVEETGLDVTVERELHDPGTLISPLIKRPYSPVYFLVSASGDPLVPSHETVEISFMDPAAVLASNLVPSPEKVALSLALSLKAET